MALHLNGFHVELSESAMQVMKATFAAHDVGPERERLGDSWFTYFHEGSLYIVAKPKSQATPLVTPSGIPAQIDFKSYFGLKFAAAMIGETIGDFFPAYPAVRERPFAFLAQKQELIAEATGGWSNLPELIKQFEIRPKYELDPRLVEFHDGDLQIALTLKLTTRWICNADLEMLSKAGVRLEGLHIVRRHPNPGERRLVGCIAKLNDGQIMLKDSDGGSSAFPATEAQLEGSRESFAHCLSHLLGKRYKQFNDSLDIARGKLSDGPGLDRAINEMGSYLRAKNPLRLPNDLRCNVGNRIRIDNRPNFKAYVPLSPAQYCFDRSRTKLSRYAWPGIEKYGPYDRESFPKRTPRILVVCPDTVSGRISQTMQLFRDGIASIDQSRFANGFAGTFRLVNPEFVPLSVELFGVESSQISSAYRQSIEELLARDDNFDAAINILLDKHSELPDRINPYLISKAVLLSNGIPVQEARASTLTKEPASLQYILQNLATALYAKMGGIPWTVDHGETADDELVIGLGTAELSGNRFERGQRHIGITTVFRGDGNYLLSNLSRECSFEDYPEVLRNSTVRILKEVKQRNQWLPGHTVRVVFHAFKPLKNIEIAEIVESCVKEVGTDQNIEFAFLTVSHDHSFMLLDNAEKGVSPRYGTGSPKGVYVPQRGMLTQLGKQTRLLCTTGPNMMKRPNLPLPRPLLLHLHKESSYRDFPYLADQILKFTALSWRSTLPTDRPVTILYSSLIAELLGRLQAVADWSPAVLNTKLRNSKWFL